MRLSLLAFSVGAAGQVLFTEHAPLLGPSFVANFDPSNATAISQARAAIPSQIDELLSSGVLASEGLVFSLDVFSAGTNGSLYSYNHVPEDMQGALSSGVLNDRTISRTGSVSKLFTVYALIAKGGMEILNHPITRYIPELTRNGSAADPLTQIRFEDITVGALASHQGGTGGAEDVLAVNLENPQAVTNQQAYDYLLNMRPPVIAPHESSIYSDGGYLLLTSILERLTGLAYQDAISELLSEPLGLEDTYFPAPTGDDLNSLNLNPVTEESAWGLDVPVVAGSGGIYSSHADLRALGLSILNSNILSPLTTRHWLKPLGGTGSLLEMVGAPWEIARLAIPVSPGSEHTRISDLYMKAGGVKGYGAIFAISPDHGIGFSVLTAGEGAGAARFAIRDIVGTAFIPAAEHAAEANAKQNLAGTFIGSDGPESSNLTLSVDEEGVGLVLESFYINGTDQGYVLAGVPEPLDLTLRVYPTGVNSEPTSLSALYRPDFTGLVSHRIASYAIPPTPRAAVEGGEGLFDNTRAWANIDYVGPFDQLIFEFVGGRVVSVTSPLLETVFTRAFE